MLRAAQAYCDLIRDEFRHQVKGPLERFQREIDGILESYAQRGPEGLASVAPFRAPSRAKPGHTAISP